MGDVQFVSMVFFALNPLLLAWIGNVFENPNCGRQNSVVSFPFSTAYDHSGFNIKARAMPNWLVHIMKYVSSDVKLMSEMLDSRCKYDISKVSSGRPQFLLAAHLMC